MARRVGSLATRIRSQRARNRLPDSPQAGYGPSGRGLRPVHLGNVGSEVFDAERIAARGGGAVPDSFHRCRMTGRADEKDRDL